MATVEAARARTAHDGVDSSCNMSLKKVNHAHGNPTEQYELLEKIGTAKCCRIVFAVSFAVCVLRR